MVKIINTAGDIKTGVQGRAVYQRKYGQQIRRTREPKRAIASETQIRHRELYKAALQWRKSLSLANRRFLEGYAIANWIVDDHKIPLPWHRLALKLYLEHVHFNFLIKPTAGETGDWQEFEAFKVGDSSYTSFYSNIWKGQTFTPQESHTLDRIDVKVYRWGGAGYNGFCTLYLADEGHIPIGSALGEGTFFGGDVPTGAPAWFTITMPNIALVAETEYVLMLHLSGGNINSCIRYRFVLSGNPYARGQHTYSSDGGSSWGTNSARDATFKEFGTLAGTPGQPGEIEIRHPAIKTITQKHEGVVIPRFDTMSDLDTERLTNRLTVPADISDEILVTTVCGLQTKYQV